MISICTNTNKKLVSVSKNIINKYDPSLIQKLVKYFILVVKNIIEKKY